MPSLGLALGLSFPTGISGGGVGSPAPEITQVVCVADVSGDKHGTCFLISDASGRVSVTLDNGAIAKVSSFDFTGRDAAWFGTGGGNEGRYLMIQYGTTLLCVWFSAEGGEIQPPVPADSYFEIAGSLSSADYEFASLFVTALGGYGSGLTAAAVAEFTFNARGADNMGNSGVAITSISVGRDAASDPGLAPRNIMCGYSSDGNASAVAADLYGTLSSETAWAVVVNNEFLTFTDAATGDREDAADHDTGFTITTPQQGT